MSSASISKILAFLLLLTQVEATPPEPPIPRGLPNVSERTTAGWEVFGDALAWYASEETSAVWADILKIGDNTSSFTPQNLPFDWKFGFRIGAGYTLEYDQWDTQLSWTWYRTKADQTQTVHPQFIPLIVGTLVTQSIEPELFAGAVTGNPSQTSNIQWTLLYNMFDWELGRCYWVSEGLSIRPFVGLKGGWIDQSIQVSYDNIIIDSALTTNSAIERVKNNFWGVGPSSGVKTQWKLHNFATHYPSLFGDFSAATMWGSWSCNDLYNNTLGKTVAAKTRNSTLGALMFKGFLGLGWDIDLNNPKSHFSTQLGYEMQIWFNQLRFATIQLERLHGDLTLQGITFNCQLDF